MAVLNKRVIVKAGLLRRKTVELFLSKVESIGVEQGLPGRMMGYGSGLRLPSVPVECP